MQEYQGDTRKKILDSMDESAFVHKKKKSDKICYKYILLL